MMATLEYLNEDLSEAGEAPTSMPEDMQKEEPESEVDIEDLNCTTDEDPEMQQFRRIAFPCP